MNESHLSSIIILDMAKEELEYIKSFEDEKACQILDKAIQKIQESILEIKHYLKYTQDNKL